MKNKITQIQKQLLQICQIYHRDNVQLLAVSKGQSAEAIRAAYELGLKQFGENYLQEALTKMQRLQDLKIEWHFIGKIQRNKTKLIAEHFSFVHSLDDEIIAQRLNQQRPDNLAPLSVCIQVNLDNEESKSGLLLQAVEPFLAEISSYSKLNCRGLMVIPKATNDIKKQRSNFSKAHEYFLLLKEKGYDLDTLSMGMSADYEAAIAEGATIIRLGTAIFGERRQA